MSYRSRQIEALKLSDTDTLKIFSFSQAKPKTEAASTVPTAPQTETPNAAPMPAAQPAASPTSTPQEDAATATAPATEAAQPVKQQSSSKPFYFPHYAELRTARQTNSFAPMLVGQRVLRTLSQQKEFDTRGKSGYPPCVLGFDVEYDAEHNPVTIQFSGERLAGIVWLVDISKNDAAVPQALADLLASEEVIKVGVGVIPDSRSLSSLLHKKVNGVCDIAGIVGKAGIHSYCGLDILSQDLLGESKGKRETKADDLFYYLNDAFLCYKLAKFLYLTLEEKMEPAAIDLVNTAIDGAKFQQWAKKESTNANLFALNVLQRTRNFESGSSAKKHKLMMIRNKKENAARNHTILKVIEGKAKKRKYYQDAEQSIEGLMKEMLAEQETAAKAESAAEVQEIQEAHHEAKKSRKDVKKQALEEALNDLRAKKNQGKKKRRKGKGKGKGIEQIQRKEGSNEKEGQDAAATTSATIEADEQDDDLESKPDGKIVRHNERKEDPNHKGEAASEQKTYPRMLDKVDLSGCGLMLNIM